MKFNSGLEEAIRGLQNRGVIRKDFQAREMALFTQFAHFGRIFRDLDPTMGSRNLQDWSAMLRYLHDSFLTE